MLSRIQCTLTCCQNERKWLLTYALTVLFEIPRHQTKMHTYTKLSWSSNVAFNRATIISIAVFSSEWILYSARETANLITEAPGLKFPVRQFEGRNYKSWAMVADHSDTFKIYWCWRVQKIQIDFLLEKIVVWEDFKTIFVLTFSKKILQSFLLVRISIITFLTNKWHRGDFYRKSNTKSVISNTKIKEKTFWGFSIQESLHSS